MSMIEKYWGDVSIFVVGFTARPNTNLTRDFRKTLIFPSGTTKEDVFHLVHVYFQHIEEVLYVDELTDGLLLKEQSR